jgi:hypothetical protein
MKTTECQHTTSCIKYLGAYWLLETFCPASAFVTVDRDEPANPKHFIHVTVSNKLKMKTISLKLITFEIKKNHAGHSDK